MAVIDIGSDASNRSSDFGVATFVTLNNPANDTGVLDTFEVYLASNVSGLKIGTFSKSGDYFTPRDFEGIGIASSGSKQTFTGKNCDVSSGDYLGVYYTEGKIDKDNTGGDGVYYYISGDGFGGTYIYTLLNGDIMSAYATGTTGGGATVKPHYYYLQQ
jgi:hypothetical protein